MKRITLFFALLTLPFMGWAQEEAEADAPKDGWTKGGTISLLFNQAAFNAEWLGGGTSNYAGNLAISYDFNYRNGKWTWDNKILADYGITRIKDDDFAKKTNDRLELNSVLGYQINDSKWSYSYFMNFRTQIAKGYAFGEDVNGNETRTEITNFLSPGYLQTGPGLLWKDSDNLKVNIAPATARLIFVDDVYTTAVGYVDGSYFGVDAGKSTRFEFGAAIGAYAKFNLMENISMENILNLYSNYLEDPQNVDVDYTMNLVMQVNSFISANIAFQAIYDDNAIGAFQIREALGLGVNFKI